MSKVRNKSTKEFNRALGRLDHKIDELEKRIVVLESIKTRKRKKKPAPVSE